MKKYLILIYMLSFGITSCNKDFLNLVPEDNPTSGSFFKTEQHFQDALAASYTALRAVYNVDYVLAEMRSDNTHYDYYSSDRSNGNFHKEQIADFMDDAINNYTNGFWVQSYKGIFRTNVVLDHIQDAEFSDAAKNPIIGEAKFLRALFYYNLVRYYAGVPLYLHEVSSVDDAYFERSSEAEVYKSIIDDATDAIQKLSAPTVFPQSGRATKGSALSLLADVYMTQKRYADAEPLLKQVTQMGYGLQAAYASIYALANKNSKESIFEVQYKQGATDGQQSNFIYQFIPRVTNSTNITGVNTNSLNTGGFNTPTNDLISSYEPNDTRLDASIAISEGIDVGGAFTPQVVKSIVNYVAPAGKIGKPFIKKYLHTHLVANNTDDNWPIYRYSEVLLFLAECLNEQGKSAEALTYLNLVRVRAGLTPSVTVSQTLLRDVIDHERRIELAFENKRWHDLVRTGKAIQVMNAYGATLKASGLYPNLAADSYQVTSKHLLFPIPNRERTINIKITQNPGYLF